MMYNDVTESIANAMLKQMGATSVEMKPTYINTVKFDLSDSVQIVYVYEEKENENTIYLQRTEPYEMYMGVLADEDELAQAIENDLKMFKCAYNSSNFDLFLKLAKEVSGLDESIENLYMNHNVEPEDLKKLNENIDEFNAMIEVAKKNSKEL